MPCPGLRELFRDGVLWHSGVGNDFHVYFTDSWWEYLGRFCLITLLGNYYPNSSIHYLNTCDIHTRVMSRNWSHQITTNLYISYHAVFFFHSYTSTRIFVSFPSSHSGKIFLQTQTNPATISFSSHPLIPHCNNLPLPL